MALLFEPLADAQFIFSGSEQTGLILGVLMALLRIWSVRTRRDEKQWAKTYIVEDEHNFTLSRSSRC